MPKTWLIAGILILALLIAGIWYWATRPEPIKTTEEAIKVLTETSSVEKAVAPTNPLSEKVPELNPVDKANPFKESYKNPFAP